MFQRLAIARVGLSLLAMLLILTGCVGQWTPEESAARTATVSAYQVPTKVPGKSTKEPPAPEPQPTKANTPTPVSAAPQESSAADLPVGVQIGQRSPDFALKDAAGQELNLSSLQGQPVAVIFWASWCPHCEKEMPLMQSMYEQYGDQGLAVIGVNVPGLGGDTKDKAQAFVAEKGITFPVLFDEGGRVYQEYRVSGVPNLIFIDREGVVVSNYPGAMEAELLEEQIRQLVEEG